MKVNSVCILTIKPHLHPYSPIHLYYTLLLLFPPILHVDGPINNDDEFHWRSMELTLRILFLIHDEHTCQTHTYTCTAHCTRYHSTCILIWLIDLWLNMNNNLATKFKSHRKNEYIIYIMCKTCIISYMKLILHYNTIQSIYHKTKQHGTASPEKSIKRSSAPKTQTSEQSHEHPMNRKKQPSSKGIQRASKPLHPDSGSTSQSPSFWAS